MLIYQVTAVSDGLRTAEVPHHGLTYFIHELVLIGAQA